MISISSVSSLKYYVEDENVEGTPSNNIINVVSSGSLKVELGLKTRMSFSELENVFSGCDAKGKKLLRNSNIRNKKGWDVTFSAPKPVSVVWARAGDALRNNIGAAHHNAVIDTIKFLEIKAAYTRVGQAGRLKQKTKGFAALIFEHYRSRADDVQLHSHVLIPNLTLRADEKWASIDSQYLFEWSHAATQVYRALLAMGLRNLGFNIVRVEDTDCFTLLGIDKAVCKAFSKRTQDIKTKIEKMGLEDASASTRNKVVLYSRLPKSSSSPSHLLAKWQSEMSSMGYEEEDLHNSINVLHKPALEMLPILQVMKKLTRQKATLSEAQIYERVAIEAQFFHVTLLEIINTVTYILEHKWLLGPLRGRTGKAIYSTSFILNVEKDLIALAKQLRNKRSYQLSPHTILTAISKQESEQGFNLSAEQKNSVGDVCKTGLDILQGRAGAGKSTSMKALRIAYELSGFKVVGATIAKNAASQLEEETGIRSSTFAKLLIDIKHKNNSFRNTVILIDEAGLIPSSGMLELLKGIMQADAKLVLVGETEQLAAIEHAGCLLYLSKLFGFGELSTIYRQRERWAKELVSDLRQGNSTKALKAMGENGLLHISDSKAAAMEKLVACWESFIDKNPDKQYMVLANSWKDVKPLNELIRKKLQEKCLVGNEDVEVECVISDKYFCQKFSCKDQIRFTKNDHEKGLINGQLGTIIDIKKVDADILFTVLKDSSETIKVLKSEYSDDNDALQLVHAYAITVYSSQGSTVDGDTFVFYNKAMNRAASYVAGSRHKDHCNWFVDGSNLGINNNANIVAKEDLDTLQMKKLAEYMSYESSETMALEHWGNTL